MVSNIRNALSVQSILSHVVSLIGFLYRVFIFVQMCCLGYGESLRLKKYINFVLINSRKLRVN